MRSKPDRISQEYALPKWTCYLAAGVLLVMLGGLLAACGPAAAVPAPGQTQGSQMAYSGKKILFVNSYHAGYEWSDGIENGIKSVLEGTGVELKIVYLDTKQNPDEAYCRQAGAQAKAEIDAFTPDVVIAADDNAQKYVVLPYLQNGSLPVVFCGVNWDASMYGYPSGNMTGMIEVELPGQLVDHLKAYAKGDSLGYLTVDSETEQKVARIYNETFFNGQMKVYWVKTWEEFKQAFVTSQNEVAILFLGNNAGIDHWDEAEAEAFIRANTKVPTGTINSWLAPYSLITLAKRAEEQGEWSARAALQILDGTPASEIAVVTNKDGNMILNLDIAEQLGVVFSPSLLRNAEVYEP